MTNHFRRRRHSRWFPVLAGGLGLALSLVLVRPTARRQGGPHRHRTQQRNSRLGRLGRPRLAGRTARIQIVDNNTSGWGHIMADQFTFADALSANQRAHWLDYGRDLYAGVTFNNTRTTSGS